MTKNDLVKMNDGRYNWNPVFGETYPLGYHHGQVCGYFPMGQKEVKGIFFGTIEGEYKFFRQEEDKIFEYSSSDSIASWLYEDDGPCSPIFKTSFVGEVPEGKIKNLIIKSLKRLEGKLQSNSL